VQDVFSVVLRAISFVLLFQAAGAALFVAIFGRRLERSMGSIRRTGQIAALAGIVFVAAHYALEAARMAGELSGIFDPSMQAIVWSSASRAALIARIGGLALIAIALRRTSAWSALVGIAGALLTVLAFTLTGHTSTGPYRGVLGALLALHLLIVAFWFGALCPLYVASLRETPARASELIERFTALATWLVPAILLAGIVMAGLLIPSATILTQPYGELLIAKVVGYALLMGLAAANKWRLGPAISRGAMHAARRFRQSVGAEYALIVAVLAVTAVMTSFFSPK
jgi:putative copper export protein